MTETWFEMRDLRNRKLDKSVWVSIRADKIIRNNIKYGRSGYLEEFIGYGSLMIPIDKKFLTNKLNWDDIGIQHAHSFNYLHGDYSESDKYENREYDGIHLVLNQSFDNNYDNNEWHLHQDLVINLGLKREGDIWVCPRYGFTEVAKLERDDEGAPIQLQIRNQFLKDYLAARNCGLYITSYFSRDEIFENRNSLTWSVDFKSHKNGKDIWECRVLEVHEGGFPFGQKIAISHASRLDVDENDDVPDISRFPTHDNVKSEFYERNFEGKKLYRVMAELWKYDWINPTKSSPITLGHKENIDIFFIIDASGNKVTAKELTKSGKWLWFRPELVSALLAKRGSFLKWYTKDTGSLSCAPASGVHFGVNDLGLITVYAKDIGQLPLWQQQIWVSYNITPDGGISKELYSSQAALLFSSFHCYFASLKFF